MASYKIESLKYPQSGPDMIGETVAHYEIVEKLGGGGMGVVYKARDAKLDRFVALKFLPAELGQSDEAKTRFIQEAKAASALDHPNICTIHDIGETDDDRLFIVMAHYAGETLKKKIERGPVPLAEALDLAAQVARGLEAAHQAGIVHRDIKPANILLSHRGEAKIVDFGLAKLAGGLALTRTGSSVGTPAYMSPEQARGEEVDQRSDLWSLGVVLYEMVSARRPFGGDHEQAVVHSILNQEPPPLAAAGSGIPAALARVVERCLAKRPEERYPGAAELLQDLAKLETELEAPTLERPAAADRTPLARRGAIWAAVGVGGAALLAGLLLTRPWQTPETPPTAAEIDSLAVLPLDNLMGDPEQEYFVDGMTEALIANLAQIGSLKVISRTSVMRFKETDKSLPAIARELGVAGIVEGSVLRAGDQVRITAQLIDAASDRHLWAQSYEGDLSNVLALQSQVARSIAQEIHAALTPREEERLRTARTVDPEAHEAYLKGRYYWNQRTDEGVRKALEHFQQALRIDPTYAAAWAGVADCHTVGYGEYLGLAAKEAYPRAKAAAQKAVELDPELAEVWTALAPVRMEYDWDWQGAEEAFLKALELNPGYATAHHWYGEFLLAMRRFEESIAHGRKAVELDPLSLIIRSTLGEEYYAAGRHGDAIEQCRQTLQMEPDFIPGRGCLGLALLAAGREREGVRQLAASWRLSGMNEEAVKDLEEAYEAEGTEGFWRRLLAALEEMSKNRFIGPRFLLECYAQLGEYDKAVALLEQGYEDRDALLVYTQSWPAFDPLREDPRFQAIVARMDFPE